MKELLDKIMEIDHAANDRLNEAIRKKEEAKKQVDLKKEAISREIEDYAKKHLEDFEASQQKDSKEAIEHIDQKLAEKKQKLQDIYGQKQEEWVCDLFSKIIGKPAV